jgi:hypothetical protein
MKKHTITTLLSLLVGASLMAANPETPEPPASPEAPAVIEGEPFLGVVSERVRKSLAVHLGIPKGVGLTVEQVVKGSAAEEYGVKEYDIMMEIDGQMLTSVSHLGVLLDMHRPGDKIDLKVLRKGEYVNLEVVLGSKGQRKSSKEFSMDFGSISELGERLQGLLEDEEHLRALEEHLPDAEEIERRVHQALSKAKYMVHEYSDNEGGQHTSIVHSGSTRTIMHTDDGTLIVTPEDGQYKVLALDSGDEVLFSGMTDKDGKQLEGIGGGWVQERFLKMTDNIVSIVVDEDVEIQSSVTVDSSVD